MEALDLNKTDLRRTTSYQLHRLALLLVDRLDREQQRANLVAEVRKWRLRRRMRMIVSELLSRRSLDDVLSMAAASASDVHPQERSGELSRRYVEMIRSFHA